MTNLTIKNSYAMPLSSREQLGQGQKNDGSITKKIQGIVKKNESVQGTRMSSESRKIILNPKENQKTTNSSSSRWVRPALYTALAFGAIVGVAYACGLFSAKVPNIQKEKENIPKQDTENQVLNTPVVENSVGIETVAVTIASTGGTLLGGIGGIVGANKLLPGSDAETFINFFYQHRKTTYTLAMLAGAAVGGVTLGGVAALGLTCTKTDSYCTRLINYLSGAFSSTKNETNTTASINGTGSTNDTTVQPIQPAQNGTTDDLHG